MSLHFNIDSLAEQSKPTLIGNSQEWAAVTFKVSAKLLSKVIDIFLEEIQPILAVRDVIPSMIMQPINKDEIRLFGKNGGNCLGISDGDGPLIREFCVPFHAVSAHGQ